jgi:hypothetical protein
MADVHAVIDHSVQSVYSDPRECAGLFDEIEPTVQAVSAMARNVVVHYRASGRQLPEHSREDISLRWVDAMLATDQTRHQTPLTAGPKTWCRAAAVTTHSWPSRRCATTGCPHAAGSASRRTSR